MTTSRYPYVHVDVPPEESEVVSFELWEAGALGVEERDASTLDASELEGFVTLVASFGSDEEAVAAKAAFVERFDARIVHVEGDEWRDKWKERFRPTRIGPRVTVCPSWEDYQPSADEVVVTIDPGAAFGTGLHETTRLVLRAVDARVRGGETILDVGCGSGILSIAALLLGAKKALCVDIDPLAVDVTSENAEHNGVHDRLELSATPIEAVAGRYDLVLANIQSHILIPMADALKARVAEGGTLVLSGILTTQVEDIQATFGPAKSVDEDGEWVAMVYHDE